MLVWPPTVFLSPGDSLRYRLLRQQTGDSFVEVPAIWAIEPSSVANIDAAGNLTALAPGSGRLNATADGGTTVHPIEVVTGPVEEWEGTYVLRSCSAAYMPRCSMMTKGGPYPIGIQIRLVRDGVTARAELTLRAGTFNEVGGAVEGSTRGNALVLSGNLTQTRVPQQMCCTFVSSWDVTIDGDQMHGTFVQVDGNPLSQSGWMWLTNEISTLRRVR